MTTSWGMERTDYGTEKPVNTEVAGQPLLCGSVGDKQESSTLETRRIRAGFLSGVHPDVRPEGLPALPVILQQHPRAAEKKRPFSWHIVKTGGGIVRAGAPLALNPHLAVPTLPQGLRGSIAPIHRLLPTPAQARGAQRCGLTPRHGAGRSWGTGQAGKQPDDASCSLPATDCRNPAVGERGKGARFP